MKESNWFQLIWASCAILSLSNEHGRVGHVLPCSQQQYGYQIVRAYRHLGGRWAHYTKLCSAFETEVCLLLIICYGVLDLLKYSTLIFYTPLLMKMFLSQTHLSLSRHDPPTLLPGAQAELPSVRFLGDFCKLLDNRIIRTEIRHMLDFLRISQTCVVGGK